MFQLIRDLPRFGVGSKVTRVTWPPDSYWTVVDVRPKLVRGARGVPSTHTPRKPSSWHHNPSP